MKAVRFHEHGGLERLVYEDVPELRPGEDEAVIRVRSCALNHVDLWVLQGGPRFGINLPHTPGCEFAGDILSVGERVTGFKPGDRVVIDPGLKDFTCDYCLRGMQSQCAHFGIIGVATDGGFAEQAAVPAANLIHIPEGVSYDEIAGIPLVFLTAWHMLVTRARLQPGETVLILASGSGIGSAAVQIAKMAGARVLAAAGSDVKLEKSKALGADEVINYSRQDFSVEARRLTGGKGVDVVFEHVGSETFGKSVDSLDRGGRLVICGATTGAAAQINLQYLYSREISLIGSMLGSRSELDRIIDLVGQGRLRAVIDTSMPLADAAAALQLMQDRKQFGKILLHP